MARARDHSIRAVATPRDAARMSRLMPPRYARAYTRAHDAADFRRRFDSRARRLICSAITLLPDIIYAPANKATVGINA